MNMHARLYIGELMWMQACNQFNKEMLQSQNVLRICADEYCKNEIASFEKFEIKIFIHKNALHMVK